MAWSRAEDEVRAFIERTQAAVPQLADGQGRDARRPPAVGRRGAAVARAEGSRPDRAARRPAELDHALRPVAALRPDVRIIQLDISAEQLSHNVPTEVGLVGDGKAVMAQLNAALDRPAVVVPADTPWREAIAEKIEGNAGPMEPMANDDSTPMNYYRALPGHQRRSRPTRSSSARARTRWTSAARS